MTYDNLFDERAPNDVPPPPDDSDNEALADAAKTYMITVIGGLMFCVASLLIVMATRMG